MPILTRPAFSLVLISFLLLAACGEGEEEEPAAQDRCGPDGFKSFLVGHIDDGDARTPLRITATGETPGISNGREIRVQVGRFTPPGDDREEPVLLRIYDAKSDDVLLRRISELTLDGPLTLDVIDASQVSAGSEGHTELRDFDCAIDDGTICVQFGFDSVGDSSLQDEDEFAYNATGGSVTIDGIDNIRRQFTVQLDVELGRNVLGFQDESTGAVEGCLTPNYETGTDFWPLS